MVIEYFELDNNPGPALKLCIVNLVSNGNRDISRVPLWCAPEVGVGHQLERGSRCEETLDSLFINTIRHLSPRPSTFIIGCRGSS